MTKVTCSPGLEGRGLEGEEGKSRHSVKPPRRGLVSRSPGLLSQSQGGSGNPMSRVRRDCLEEPLRGLSTVVAASPSVLFQTGNAVRCPCSGQPCGNRPSQAYPGPPCRPYCEPGKVTLRPRQYRRGRDGEGAVLGRGCPHVPEGVTQQHMGASSSCRLGKNLASHSQCSSVPG